MTGAATGQKSTVYIVDPDQGHTKDLSALLLGQGFDVSVFSKATDFIAEVHDHPPTAMACVISEMSLPDMNGLDMVSRLRGEGSAIPVVFLTSDSSVNYAVKAMQTNVADYLVKPYVERVLVNRVKSLLSGGSADNATGAT